MGPDEVEVKDSMENHTPNDEQIQIIENLRNAYKEVRTILKEQTLDGREQSIALTRLEDSLMWAVKGVILNE